MDKTFTRREAARELGVSPNHLIYWERQGKLKPGRVRVGNRSLVVYTPRLIERARGILERPR